MKTPDSFRHDEWNARQVFVGIISQICAEQGIALEWLCDTWVGQLQKNGIKKYIYAYRLPLNDAASTSVGSDKVATYEVLRSNSIPAVAHYLIRASTAVSNIPTIPCVIKPCHSGSGHDVYKANTQDEASTIIASLQERYNEIAIAPFETIEREYRVIVLQKETLLVFAKAPKAGEWRHNLSRGGTTEIVANTSVRDQLATLAKEAATALGLTFCAVDIITTKTSMKLLEVNVGFSLSRVGDNLTASVHDIYRAALQLCFSTGDGKA